jgi:hypothetical protein
MELYCSRDSLLPLSYASNDHRHIIDTPYFLMKLYVREQRKTGLSKSKTEACMYEFIFS